MAVYGRGQMLGAGVQPGMFMQDYSGFAQAGAMQGKMLAGIGQSIASGIEGFQEKKKEQSNIERQIKKADNVAKAIADLVPELAPTIEASRAELNDLNIPQNDRLAVAEGINDILNMGLGEVKRQRESTMQRQELAARMQEQRMKPPTLAELPVPGGTQTVEWNPDIGAWVEPSFDLAAPPVGLVPEQIQELLKTYPREEVEGIVSNALRQSGMPEKEIPMEAQIAIDSVLGDVLPPMQTRVGFAPTKTTDEGKGQWEQNVQAGSLLGQRNSATGEFKPYPGQTGGRAIRFNPETGEFEVMEGAAATGAGSAGGVKLQSGEMLVEDPTSPTGSRIVPIPGGEAEKQRKAEIARKQAASDSAKAMVQDLNSIREDFLSINPQAGTIPAIARMGLAKIPGQQLKSMQDKVDRFVSGLTVEGLQNIRANSPTGGALGNVSNADIDLLKNMATSLKAANTPQAFAREYIRLSEKLMDKVYGSSESRAQLVKDGILSEQENLSIEQNYPSETINLKGEIVPRIKPAATPIIPSISPEVQEILKKYPR